MLHNVTARHQKSQSLLTFTEGNKQTFSHKEDNGLEIKAHLGKSEKTEKYEYQHTPKEVSIIMTR